MKNVDNRTDIRWEKWEKNSRKGKAENLIAKPYLKSQEIETENVYEDMRHYISKFDSSHYKIKDIQDMPFTKSMVDKFKDVLVNV